jgi:acyl carrier protein
MSVVDELKEIISDALGLGVRRSTLTEASRLLGSIPELDSMAVVNVLTALEDHFGISIADDEISADMFSTLGTLAAFVQAKVDQRPPA